MSIASKHSDLLKAEGIRNWY